MMSDACSNPNSKYAIDAHVWIGAFAAALISFTLIYYNAIGSLGGAIGISGLAVQKLNGEVASLQQEIDALKLSLDAMRTVTAKPAERAGPAVAEQPAPARRHP